MVVSKLGLYCVRQHDWQPIVVGSINPHQEAIGQGKMVVKRNCGMPQIHTNFNRGNSIKRNEKVRGRRMIINICTNVLFIAATVFMVIAMTAVCVFLIQLFADLRKQ